MWYNIIKRAFDAGHELYTLDGVRMFVEAGKISAEEYEEITGVKY